MDSRLDSSIIKALSLDPRNTQVASHGGSGFSTTAKITTEVNGEERYYFLKTGTGQAAKVMFEGEHTSLNAIHAVVPSLCPSSLAYGSLSDSHGFFLVTEFLDLHSTSNQSKGLALAAKLAKLHTTPAPIPSGFAEPGEFFAENRLRMISAEIERHQGKDGQLRAMIEKMISVVTPRLLGDERIGGGEGVIPVVVHGDLWSGNKSRGRIGAEGEVEEVIFDPSSCYAHSEYEHGIMKMFGGFDDGFWSEYFQSMPKTLPANEYNDRVALYEL
ncbi:MAG: hypothetical protein M1816_001304 [Peltula sp. TS41687]|nr:MAG: hypothetical protein M1816_001304 [Peltula sp. TS41687]